MKTENTQAKNAFTNVALNPVETSTLQRDAISGTEWFDSYLKSYARAICNGCGSEIGTVEMNDFHKNDGYCNTCNQ